MNSTASDKVDQQDTSLKKGKTNENIFSEVQMSQSNDLINEDKGNLYKISYIFFIIKLTKKISDCTSSKVLDEN